MERVPTGIDELDVKLSGGYPQGKAILVTGAPGAGKTIFGIHFLYKACMDGRRCVDIATEESPEDILVQAEMLGLDLRPYLDNKQLAIERVLETRTESTEMASQLGFGFETTEMDLLERAKMLSDDIDVVVIDNIGVFALDLNIKEFRDKIDANKAGSDVFLFGILSLGEIASTGDKYIELYNKTVVVGMVE